jgi:hypothetical protein
MGRVEICQLRSAIRARMFFVRARPRPWRSEPRWALIFAAVVIVNRILPPAMEAIAAIRVSSLRARTERFLRDP